MLNICPLPHWTHSTSPHTVQAHGRTLRGRGDGHTTGWPAHTGLASWDLAAFSEAALLRPAWEGRRIWGPPCGLLCSLGAGFSLTGGSGQGWGEQRALAFLSRAREPARSSLQSNMTRFPKLDDWSQSHLCVSSVIQPPPPTLSSGLGTM